MFDNGIGGRCAVFREDRVGHAVREMAIRLVMHFYEFERKVLFEFVDYQAGAAVAGVDHDGHGAEGGGIDVTQ